MLRFLFFRILQFPLILAIIYVLTFLLAWVAPGSPFERERKLPEQTRAYLEEHFHANSPLKFLTYYPWRIITTGDFGPSLNRPGFRVNDTLRDALPVSVALGLAAVAIALVGGVTIGTIAAVKRNGPFDWASLGVALIGVSVPSFVAAALMLMAFAVHWKVFPLGGWPQGAQYQFVASDSPQRRAAYQAANPELRDVLDQPAKYFDVAPHAGGDTGGPSYDISERPGVKVDDLAARTGFNFDPFYDWPNPYFLLRTRWLATIADYIWHGLLPAIALALLPMAYITRLTRVSMIDVLASDFVRTARAKGLSRPRVIVKHCLRNALLPVLSYLGPAAAATMTGSFVVETVFGIPGMGRDFVNSVLNRDQTLILGTVMAYSVLLLALNLMVDVLYGFVDPRIEVGGKAAGR